MKIRALRRGRGSCFPEGTPEEPDVVEGRHTTSFVVLSSGTAESLGLFDWVIPMSPLRLGDGGHFSTANENPNGKL